MLLLWPRPPRDSHVRGPCSVASWACDLVPIGLTGKRAVLAVLQCRGLRWLCSGTRRLVLFGGSGLRTCFARNGIVRYRTIPYDIVRYRTTSYDTVRYRTISYGIVRYRVVHFVKHNRLLTTYPCTVCAAYVSEIRLECGPHARYYDRSSSESVALSKVCRVWPGFSVR